MNDPSQRRRDFLNTTETPINTLITGLQQELLCTSHKSVGFFFRCITAGYTQKCVTLDHKTSLKCQVLQIWTRASSES